MQWLLLAEMLVWPAAQAIVLASQSTQHVAVLNICDARSNLLVVKLCLLRSSSFPFARKISLFLHAAMTACCRVAGQTCITSELIPPLNATVSLPHLRTTIALGQCKGLVLPLVLPGQQFEGSLHAPDQLCCQQAQ